MEKDTFVTKVVFRTFKNKEVVALFPEQLEIDYCIGSYMRIGQHCHADYDTVIQRTKPSKPEEYADLKNELESIGYNLRIMQKCRPNFSKRF
jgi:predicted nucleotidyltransferase